MELYIFFEFFDFIFIFFQNWGLNPGACIPAQHPATELRPELRNYILYSTVAGDLYLVDWFQHRERLFGPVPCSV